MKRIRKKRVLAKISSRHGTRDLPCKFPEQIYYSKSQKQQRKEGIKHTSRHKDKEWQEDQDKGTGRLQMHIHRNRQAIGQGQKDSNKANKLLN